MVADADMKGAATTESAAISASLAAAISNATASDIPNEASKKIRLSNLMRKIENELRASSDYGETGIKANSINTSTDVTNETSPQNESNTPEMDKSTTVHSAETTVDHSTHNLQNENKTKSPSPEKTVDHSSPQVTNAISPPKKLAPEPPRWRFVDQAKSTLGYSSKSAGFLVRGMSATELGAEYTAPEITKDVKVRTIEQFELVAPQEQESELKKERQIGKLTSAGSSEKTEEFLDKDELQHQPKLTPPQASESKKWQPSYHSTLGVSPYARKNGGESFDYEHDPIPVLKYDPPLEHRPPDDKPPTDTNRVVGKLEINSPDGIAEEFRGDVPKRKMSSSINIEDTSAICIVPDSSNPMDFNISAGGDLTNHEHSSPSDNGDGDLTNCEHSSQTDNGNELLDSENVKSSHVNLDDLIATTCRTTSGDDSSRGNFSERNDHSEVLGEKQISSQPTPDTQKKWKRNRWLLLPLLLLAVVVGAIVGTKRTSQGNETSSKVTQGLIFSANKTSWPSQSPTVFLNPDDINASVLFSEPTFSPTYQPSKYTSLTLLSSSLPSVLSSAIPSRRPSSAPITNYPSKQPIKFVGGCPKTFDPFSSYNIGTEVSREGVIYKCIGTNCGSLMYAPGGSSSKWRETWEIVGACEGSNPPTEIPSTTTTFAPTKEPIKPTSEPSTVPSLMTIETLSSVTTLVPTPNPTLKPSDQPLKPLDQTKSPTLKPSDQPTKNPTLKPSDQPTKNPTLKPSDEPTKIPTIEPSDQPTKRPTLEPSDQPMKEPSRSPTLSPVGKPTCPPQNGDFNLCLSIDMSGSVCGGGECLLCEPMTQCNSNGINKQRCCNNFDNVVEFAKELVQSLGELKTLQDFSMVHFATSADIASTLQNANQASKTLQQLVYSGGSTNLGEGIKLCQQTLDSSAAGRRNLILIITDGYPSQPTSDPVGNAKAAAIDAKNKGTFIIPILIEPTVAGDPAVQLLKEISSDGQVFLTDFGSIGGLQEVMFEQVVCNTLS